MSLLVCSIFQLLSVYPHSTTSHHLGEQRLNTVLLLNIISPSLEYSPDNLDKDIKELSQYGSSKNTSHGRSEELFIINPERESSHVQNEVNNSKDSIIVKLQNLHEIYHRIWRHDGMKRVKMESSENIREVLIEPGSQARTSGKPTIQTTNTTVERMDREKPIMEAESDALADNDDLSPDSETTARILNESHQTISRIMTDLINDIHKREISVGRLEASKMYNPREMTRVLAKERLRKLLHQLNGIVTCYTEVANTLGDPEAPEEVTQVTIARCTSCNQQYVCDPIEMITSSLKKRLRVDHEKKREQAR